MSSGISEGLRFLSGSSTPPQPATPPRRSSSPGGVASGYDSNPDTPETSKNSRKRTNTVSSGSGEKRTANKICRVCGDKAFSYNFNVITCESCKAFFRRNANKQGDKEKEVRCPFNEQCEINVVSRRFCQRCRLAKCFDVGMKKEWIMSDEARLEKKQRVEENRERRLQDALCRANETEGQVSPSRDDSSVESRGDHMNETMNTPMRPVEDRQIRYDTKIEEPIQMMDVTMTDEFERRLSHGHELPGVPQMGMPCQSHSFMDNVPTTAANSLADVTSTTASMSAMDMDMCTPMSGGSGFIPPSLDSARADLFLSPSSFSSDPLLSAGVQNAVSAVESTLMAQAAQQVAQQAAQQLVAVQVQAQVQAALNHQEQQVQQQLSTAVLVHQLAQMAGSSTDLLAPQSVPLSTMPAGMNSVLTQSLAHTIPAPIMAPSLAAPTLATPETTALLQSALNVASPIEQRTNMRDMVTIPRDVLVRLMENSNLRNQSCVCTCQCGRYPSGSVIVEEVTKDLLSNTNKEEPNKDEAKLETAEDFQMNGLLPSDDSSVQWLQNSTPMDHNMEDRNTSMDAYYGGTSIMSTDMQASRVMDADCCPLNATDQAALNEILRANQGWKECESVVRNRYEFRSPPKQTGFSSDFQKRFINMSKKLAAFRSLNHHDQLVLIKYADAPYAILRGVMAMNIKENPLNVLQRYGASPADIALQGNSTRFCAALQIELRTNESVMLVYGALILFDPDCPALKDRETVRRHHENLSRLLKRLLYTVLGQDSQRALAEHRALLEKIAVLRELVGRTIPSTASHTHSTDTELLYELLE